MLKELGTKFIRKIAALNSTQANEMGIYFHYNVWENEDSEPTKYCLLLMNSTFEVHREPKLY